MAGTGLALERVTRVRIHDFSVKGEGVGRLEDGRAVFVPGAVPGDTVEVELEGVRGGGRWTRGRLRAVVEPSPDRREPDCPLFGACGGCHLQHVTYRAQVAWKGRRIADALTRVGGIPVDAPPVEPSPAEWRYRNRMSFTLKRLRGGRVAAGLHAAGRPGRIVDVSDECRLPEPQVLRVWVSLRAAWGPGARLLPPGGELRLTLRRAGEGAVLVVEGGEPGGDAAELLSRVPGLVSVAHRPTRGELRHLAGAPETEDRWFGESVPVSSTAFMQVNREAAEALHLAVLKEFGNPAGLTVVDAYAGVGAYGRRLARHGARVTAVELDPFAAAAARAGAPEGLEVREGRVEEVLPELLPADRVILNPPRSGVDERVADLLRQTPPGRILYVSCDPATLARDLSRMGPGYRLRTVRGFDLFPQTTHVETLVVLEPEHTPSTA